MTEYTASLSNGEPVRDDIECVVIPAANDTHRCRTTRCQPWQ